MIASASMFVEPTRQIFGRSNVEATRRTAENINPSHILEELGWVDSNPQPTPKAFGAALSNCKTRMDLGWVGLEPTTNALKGRCSTIELPTPVGGTKVLIQFAGRRKTRFGDGKLRAKNGEAGAGRILSPSYWTYVQ